MTFMVPLTTMPHGVEDASWPTTAAPDAAVRQAQAAPGEGAAAGGEMPAGADLEGGIRVGKIAGPRKGYPGHVHGSVDHNAARRGESLLGHHRRTGPDHQRAIVR